MKTTRHGAATTVASIHTPAHRMGWDNITTARDLLSRERTDAQEARRWYRLACALAIALCGTCGALGALLWHEVAR